MNTIFVGTEGKHYNLDDKETISKTWIFSQPLTNITTLGKMEAGSRYVISCLYSAWPNVPKRQHKKNDKSLSLFLIAAEFHVRLTLLRTELPLCAQVLFPMTHALRL